jgi:diaminopimelate decarboxylase
MEEDVVAENVEAVSEGDILAILDAGAYDASMSYSFGRGVNSGPV